MNQKPTPTPSRIPSSHADDSHITNILYVAINTVILAMDFSRGGRLDGHKIENKRTSYTQRIQIHHKMRNIIPKRLESFWTK